MSEAVYHSVCHDEVNTFPGDKPAISLTRLSGTLSHGGPLRPAYIAVYVYARPVKARPLVRSIRWNGARPNDQYLCALLWRACLADADIIFSFCGFFFFFLFFLIFFFASSYRLQIGCLPYFYTWSGLSANLECRSEMCCTRLAENTGRKKIVKNRHLGTIAQPCRAVSSQLRHVSTIGNKY